jgi:hypothetical protein
MELDMRSTLALRYFVWTAAIGLVGTALAAQTPRTESAIHPGAWIVGGTGSLDLANSPSTQSNLSLSPQGLILVNSRLALGGEGVLSVGSNGDGHFTAWGVGPTARLFLDDVSSRILPFVSATVLPEWSHQFERASADFDERILTLDGSFGSTFMLTSRAGLTGEVYVTHFDFRQTSPAIDGTTGQTLTEVSSGGTTHYGMRFGFTVFVH